jgi:hypothetical protein
MYGIAIDPIAPFSASYGAARERFLAKVTAKKGALRHYLNPNKGPNGETLATDVAWFGPRDAAHVLVMVSATHGVEGFCGSGAQLDCLDYGIEALLIRGVAVMMVHAINPYGFAWLRRTTEEGVDLNRNAILFENGVPENKAYDELADAFLPRSIDAAGLAAAAAKLDRWRATHGDFAFDVARTSGQYTHPEGFFYGGTAPTWSMRTMAQLCVDHALSTRANVAVIDYHTGLGPFGYAEPICGHRPGTSGQARCRAWYGESLGEPLLGKSASVPIAGLTQYAWARHVGDEVLTFIALEYGTYAVEEGANALRDEHWLHAYGEVDWASSETQRIKGALRRFYYPDTRDWKEAVLLRSRQVIDQALRGMTA